MLAPMPDMTKWTPTDWQAFASVVSAFVAIAAVIVAGLAWRAAKRQATTADHALAETARAERSRRWDERVQGVVPIIVDPPGRVESAQIESIEGEDVVTVQLHVGATPVVDLRIVADVPGNPGVRPSITTVGTLAAHADQPELLLVGGSTATAGRCTRPGATQMVWGTRPARYSGVHLEPWQSIRGHGSQLANDSVARGPERGRSGASRRADHLGAPSLTLGGPRPNDGPDTPGPTRPDHGRPRWSSRPRCRGRRRGVGRGRTTR
jgi:hypothetical protein